MKQPTFSEKVKQEICNLTFEDHCLKALLSSFITSRLVIDLKSDTWKLVSQFPFIIQFLDNAFKNLYSVNTTTIYNKNATNINGQTNQITISGNFDQISRDLCLNTTDKQNLLEMECCKRAYVAGAFLAGGSISSLESKGYHLEIRSGDWEYLFFIQKMLISFGIYAVLTKHTKKQYILYIKKVDQISDFLKLVNAGNCMLAFEDKKIAKDANMSITRWNNLDISNINKTTQAGVKQVNQIKKIINTALFNKQTNKFKAFCELRLKNPSTSLSDMVALINKKYHIKTTKPGLNHIIRKLDKLSQE